MLKGMLKIAFLYTHARDTHTTHTHDTRTHTNTTHWFFVDYSKNYKSPKLQRDLGICELEENCSLINFI